MIDNFRREEYIREDLEQAFGAFLKQLLEDRAKIRTDLGKIVSLRKITPKDDTYIVSGYTDKGWDIEYCVTDRVDFESWKVEIEPKTYADTKKVRKFPKKLAELIDEFRRFYLQSKDPNFAAEIAEMREKLKKVSVDENGRQLTNKDWLEAAEKVDNGTRSLYESRAVVVDDVLVCISAAAAIEQTECFDDYREGQSSRDPRKDGDQLYKACEKSNGDFKGHRVRYAEKEEILAQIA